VSVAVSAVLGAVIVCVQFCVCCWRGSAWVAALLCSAGVQCVVAVLLGVQPLGPAGLVLRSQYQTCVQFVCSSVRVAGMAVPGVLLFSVAAVCSVMMLSVLPAVQLLGFAGLALRFCVQLCARCCRGKARVATL
jgi:hypothetical protein